MSLVKFFLSRTNLELLKVIINGAGNLGVGKSPGFKLDVSGNSNVDGDLSIVTTDPQNGTGGTVTARRIVLTDPQTGASATLDSTSAGGVSRANLLPFF